MHGHLNIKYVNTKQEKAIYQYRNTKEKLYRVNAAIWCNKVCRDKQLTPNYVSVKIKGKTRNALF